MSDHDPFDGIYNDAPAAETSDQAEESHSEVKVVAPDDVDVTVVSDEPEKLGRTELARMHKSDLQAAAQERGLDDSGSRTELIERIEAAQG